MTNQEILSRAQVWLDGNYDTETKKTICDMIANNPKALEDSFYQNLAFGTGGLRGVMGVGTNRMNTYTVGMATQGLANYLKKIYTKETIKVAVAFDNRNNSTLFANTVANVFAANGFTVYLFDALRPTPELSFAVRELACMSGVMITASHNPREYNGYKAYWSDGAQVVAPHDTNIIEEVNKIESIDDVKWTGTEGEIITIGKEIDDIYLSKIKSLSLSPESIKKHKDIKIVYTPVHGAGVHLVPSSLRNFGFENIVMVKEQSVIDGNFPTVVHPNPEDPATLEMALKVAEEENTELLLATDPDADRIAVGVRDNEGNMFLINGNQTAVLFTYYILNRYKELMRFNGEEYTIKTIVTTKLMQEISESFGVRCYDVLTGFKYIAAVIARHEAEAVNEEDNEARYVCGGEESFGFMIGDFVRDKDAVSACALFAEMVAWCKSEGTTVYNMMLSIYHKFGLYHDGLRNVVRKGIEGAAEIKQMMDDYRSCPPTEIAGMKVTMIYDYLTSECKDTTTQKVTPIELEKSNVLQFTLEDGSLVSVRPSGTEPKIKFYYGIREEFSPEMDYITVRQKAQSKIDAIEKSLGLV